MRVLECSELDIRGVLQICFKTQEYPIQPEKVADPVFITLPPRSEIPTQPYWLLLFVKSKQWNSSSHDYDNEHINIMNVKACELVASFSWM